MFYDVGQGQGWQRNIVMNGSPHLPASIRQWFGDSRGRWEGSTLVIDVTNFSPKTDYRGARENLHLTECWTRTGPNTLEYEVTIEDPTVWARPWTVKQEFTRQSDQANSTVGCSLLPSSSSVSEQARCLTATAEGEGVSGRSSDPNDGLACVLLSRR
jgi:hypothetical protein